METAIVDVLVHISCGECGISFGMPSRFYEKRKEDHQGWYCPNGHRRIFTDKSESEKRIESLERRDLLLRKNISEQHERIVQLTYSVRSQKAAKTKILNRIKNGVCPCCNRSFKDLQNHFKNKHPELLEA